MVERNRLDRGSVGERRPFLLKPVGKDYLWGGQRLKDDFAKDIEISPLAETWECSTHPDGESIVASGAFRGYTLSRVLRDNPDYLGLHPASQGLPPGQLPVLIKLIDAEQNLSVQVHPKDEYADKFENKALGKTEMWYVLDATQEASLVYGLRHRVTKEALREAIEKGTVEKFLQQVSVQRDDVFFIPAGTIHALGKGTLVAEIQENSNITYRLYDYGRRDKTGKLRPLHIDKALEVANLEKDISPQQPMRVLSYSPGCAWEGLCRCKWFSVGRMLLNTSRIKKLVSYASDEMSFRVLLCIRGCGTMLMEGMEAIPFFQGDCIFFPASSAKVQLHGRAQFLEVCG